MKIGPLSFCLIFVKAILSEFGRNVLSPLITGRCPIVSAISGSNLGGEGTYVEHVEPAQNRKSVFI